MTWIDWMAVGLVLVYAFGGFFTGVFRRLIGLVALYVAFLAATNMGLQAGQILQQSSNFEVADARIYGFFGIATAVLVIVEGATQLAHSSIQVPALVLNRLLGVIVGAITGGVLAVLVIYELAAAGNPIGGFQLDALQLRIKDAYNNSHVAVPLDGLVKKPIIGLFQPALPTDPQIYFGPSPVSQ
ncbi:MAG TPA: CvpA family protein [Verrucomicrobiae bacterium]|nr:CvpA family protein [Verrucomicrobiae bacterium]